MADSLHGLRKSFAIGAYQQVINDATNPTAAHSLSAEARAERKVYLSRAYVAQNRFKMASDDPSADPESSATRLLAAQLASLNSGSISGTADFAQEAFSLFSSTPDPSPLLAVIVASVLCNDARFEDALRVLHPYKRNLEAVALTVQVLLVINRPDLARKEIAVLKTWADDATLAQMAEAWTNLFPDAPEKFQEAFFTFDELAASNAATAKLLTSKAVCKIEMGKFDEAEELLGQALNWVSLVPSDSWNLFFSKNNSDAEALVNLIICANATGKGSEVSAGYLQLSVLNSSRGSF
ncbi:hypothetical protein HDU83_008118 [Entophlyctis luteolus]|nr:hypothetical protein HDU83_008118 [Entophlyctis luteolus]